MRTFKAGVGIFLAGCALAFDNPTFLGPVFPAPLNLGKTNALTSAAHMIAANLSAAIAAAQGGMDANSFAVRAISVSEAEPLFEFYHTARSISSVGAQKVNADTVFRIGSISKLFTVYTLLLRGGFDVFEDQVTKYIPELRRAANSPNFDPVQDVNWNDITVGALARQLSGILRDCMYAILLFIKLIFRTGFN
jgi:CubicO group peptidase (beta-lactamase class C family)